MDTLHHLPIAEIDPAGWILRLTGTQTKKGGMVDDVMEHVERWFAKQ